MDKLLKHRNGSSNPMAKCYLMVARDVADWDEYSNTYNASIELYKHDSKIVGVYDVKNLTIEEIKKFLAEKGYDENQFEIVYGELCLFLDDRIALLHKQGTKKRGYNILFSSFFLQKNCRTNLMKTEAIMIDVIIDIIRSLNAGNVLSFQKDAETKIDLYNINYDLEKFRYEYSKSIN